MATKEVKINWGKLLTKDKIFLSLVVGLLVLSLAFVAYSILQIRPSDLRVMSRYNGFSSPYYYRSDWFTFFSWPALAVIIGVINNLIGLKLLAKKQRPAAIILITMSALVVVVMFLIFARIVALPR